MGVQCLQAHHSLIFGKERGQVEQISLVIRLPSCRIPSPTDLQNQLSILKMGRAPKGARLVGTVPGEWHGTGEFNVAPGT